MGEHERLPEISKRQELTWMAVSTVEVKPVQSPCTIYNPAKEVTRVRREGG